MILKACVAGALALVCVPSAKAEQAYTHPHIVQVICPVTRIHEGKLQHGVARGTAWRISKGRFASVDHVTRAGTCTINGQPITIEHGDPFGDFSIVRVEDSVDGGIPVNCNGFYHGYHYYSVGFARGAPQSVSVTLRANKLFPNFFERWQIFTGIETMIPGMSGGPVLNIRGEAVGSVNALNPKYGLSWSRSLKDTILCTGSTFAPLSLAAG